MNIALEHSTIARTLLQEPSFDYKKTRKGFNQVHFPSNQDKTKNAVRGFKSRANTSLAELKMASSIY